MDGIACVSQENGEEHAKRVDTNEGRLAQALYECIRWKWLMFERSILYIVCGGFTRIR